MAGFFVAHHSVIQSSHAGYRRDAAGEAARELRANYAARDDESCAVKSVDGSGFGPHTYDENRGVGSARDPREITIPTGSSVSTMY
jgi:hypothetical protein